MAERSLPISHGKVFNDLTEHCRGPRISTATVVFGLLRQHYPNHHVTETTKDDVSLLEFAAAGFASCNLMPDAQFTRRWFAKATKPDGDLEDEGRFAGYSYTWEGKEYFVYQCFWRDSFHPPNNMFYILKEGGAVDSKGHCIETDDLICAVAKWTSKPNQEVLVFNDGYWRKDKRIWKAVEQSSWDNVILAPGMKEQLMKDTYDFFDSEESCAELGVPWKRGIILYGSPGNGKTATIKTLAKALTRRSAPCLLVFEDLDSLVNVDVRSYFLNEVDGLESNHGILMVASANNLSKLDPAIAKRPSRFDRNYEFKVPRKEERTAFVKMWMNKTPKTRVCLNEEICDLIGDWTEGFSYAYLQELFIDVMVMVNRGTNLEDAEGAAVQGETATCQCDNVCPKCQKPYGKHGEAEKEVIPPSQNIPGHLAQNMVVKRFLQQILILREQMNEKNPPTASTEEGDGNVQSPRKGGTCC